MPSSDEREFEPLFNGRDLEGWFARPRLYGVMWPGGPNPWEIRPDFPPSYNERATAHAAVWSVEDGAIVGRQDSPGSGWGGYLVTEKKFGDFELRLEANPDWPADTGIMVRKLPHTYHGLQVLLDHRQSGSIGGFYGNGIGGFHAVPFSLDAVRDHDGHVTGLKIDDPATSLQPFDESKRRMLTFAAEVEDFLAVWHTGEWNEFRIRVVGAKPRSTVWINGVKIAEIDLASLVAPNYDADAVLGMLGSEGHIALEVHDNDDLWQESRWGNNAACRWRNIRLKRL